MATAIRRTAATPSQPATSVPSLAGGPSLFLQPPHDHAAPSESEDLGVVLALRKGSILFDDRHLAGSYFKVLSGALRVYKLLPDGRRHIAEFCIAGDIFGITDRETYEFTAEAMVQSSVARYRWRANDLVDAHPSRRLLALLCSKLAAAQEQLVVLGRMSAAERLSWFLLRMAERTGQCHAEAPIVDLIYMSRADIADHLGLAPETVSRSVAGLGRRKLISVEGQTRITLLKPGVLREMCGRRRPDKP